VHQGRHFFYMRQVQNRGNVCGMVHTATADAWWVYRGTSLIRTPPP